jgi:hypothetical protein
MSDDEAIPAEAKPLNGEPAKDLGPYGNGRWIGRKLSEGRSGKVCGAKRLDGKPCQRRPSLNGRCVRHGGATLPGIHNPNYKHGRKSKFAKFLPKHMQRTFNAMLNDSELTSMRDGLALIDARLSELLGSLDKSKAPPYERLFELAAHYRNAKTAAGRNAAFAKIEELIWEGEQSAHNTQAVWREIRNLLAQRSSALFTEAKTRKDLGQYIELEKVMVFGRAVFESIQVEIADKELCRRVFKTVLKYMPHPCDWQSVNAASDEPEQGEPCNASTPWNPLNVKPDNGIT